jgi:hypothetical protein
MPTPPPAEVEGRALLARAALLSLAAVAENGTSILRTVTPLDAGSHGNGDLLVRLTGGGSFHGFGSRVMLAAHEHVTSIDDATYAITASSIASGGAARPATSPPSRFSSRAVPSSARRRSSGRTPISRRAGSVSSAASPRASSTTLSVS